VIAVDVGHGQLHPKIRQDPRVDVHERLNIRSVDATTFGAPVDVTVADLSFISLTTVAGALLAVTDLGCPLVLLVKPQFEVGRVEASRARGVITDPELHEQARERVGRAYEAAGAAIMGWMESPLRGAEGNVEFFVHLERVR
jgi:23S rRNA (cytidine1920-2'-O)/16S rRNA (cytidine1409-2'-O)-methyltransferase